MKYGHSLLLIVMLMSTISILAQEFTTFDEVGLQSEQLKLALSLLVELILLFLSMDRWLLRPSQSTRGQKLGQKPCTTCHEVYL